MSSRDEKPRRRSRRGTKKRGARANRSSGVRLKFERLEHRDLLTAGLNVDLPDHVSEGTALVVTGTYNDLNGSAPETLNADFDGDLAIDATYTVNGGSFVVTYMFPTVSSAGSSHLYSANFELHTPFLAGDQLASKSITVDAASQAVPHGDFLLSAAGTEIPVNTFTSNAQDLPAVAIDGDGDFVVVWASSGQDTSNFGVYGQLYNRAGVAQGSEFRVNSTIANSQTDPFVAMDADGDFVVTWTSTGQDGGNDGVYGQRYNAAGVAQGSEFRVNSTTAGNQRLSSVAMDAAGNFVVAWASDLQDGSSFGIYFQRFNAAGVAQGNELRANTTTADNQTNPAVAMDADGDFAIAWQSNLQDGSGIGVYFQRFSKTGATVGGEIRANSFTTGAQALPTIAMDANGDFIVAWASSGQDGSSDGVYAQLYNNLGATVGNEFRANTFTTQAQSAPSASMDADGDFIITWESNNQDGSARGIYGQRYLKTGAASGGEFVINSFTAGNQGLPSVAMDAAGDFTVAWRSIDQDGSSYGIYAQRYQESVDAAGPVVAGVYAADNAGTPGANAIAEGDQLASSVPKLVVAISENMATAGAGSITSTANWQLKQNSVDVTSNISGITFGFNATRRRYEAVVSLTTPISSGSIELTIKATALDVAGNALDGNFDGTAGGNFVRGFSYPSALTLNTLNATNADEASDVTLSGTLTDGNSGPHTVEIDWDNNGTYDDTLSLASAVTSFSAMHAYVDDGASPGNGTITDVQTIAVRLTNAASTSVTSSTNTTISNVAPSVLTLSAGNINENGTTTLTGSFTDPGTQDVHVLRIDWADGSATQTVTLSPTGARTFSVTHQYLDDGASPGNGTASEVYTITASISDDDTGSVTSSTSTTISNVAPSALSLSAGNISENGTTTLTGSFTDPGTQDAHILRINWADGSAMQTVTLSPTGARTFSVTHPYLDDDPTGTSSDSYTVTASISDDDAGSVTNSASLSVSNINPVIHSMGATNANEAGTVTLTGTYSDAGTQDTHTLRINWADGSASQTVGVSGGSFTVTHVYADDGPFPGNGTASDAYAITAVVIDDDTGIVTSSTSITISNVAPSALSLSVGNINENGTTTLTGSFTDPGTQDVHILRINWADGSATQTVTLSPTGARSFSVTHQYLDDNPTGTSSDSYTVTTSISDDDTGSVTNSTSLSVSNINPVIHSMGATNANEAGAVTLTGTYSDVGTQDTHSLVVDWGDGNPTQTLAVSGGSFTVTHTYSSANDPHTIAVALTDDDTGTASTSTVTAGNGAAPSNLTLNAPTLTPQNNGAGSSITLTSSFVDPDAQDVHTLRINWGDGNPTQTVAVTPTGARTQTVTHFYADPNPANDTTGVQYTIAVTLNDDDTGTTSQTRTIWVDDPPKILDVTMRYGTAQSQTYNINTQLNAGTVGRTLPWVNVRAVDVLFSENVQPSLGTGDAVLSLVAGTSPVPGMATVAWNPVGTPANTARWTFTADLSFARWQFTLDNDAVGNNGIFDNNNLYLAAPNSRVFNVLPGDYDGDGSVTSSDAFWIDYYRKNGTGQTPLYPIKYADLNGDGVVNVNTSNPNDLTTDYGLIRYWLTKRLP